MKMTTRLTNLITVIALVGGVAACSDDAQQAELVSDGEAAVESAPSQGFRKFFG